MSCLNETDRSVQNSCILPLQYAILPKHLSSSSVSKKKQRQEINPECLRKICKFPASRSNTTPPLCKSPCPLLPLGNKNWSASIITAACQISRRNGKWPLSSPLPLHWTDTKLMPPSCLVEARSPTHTTPNPLHLNTVSKNPIPHAITTPTLTHHVL